MSTSEFISAAKTVASEATNHAARHDRAGSFPVEGIDALKKAGLMGLTLPRELAGKGGDLAQAAEVVRTLAESDASLAMIYLMHLAGTACLAAGRRTATTERLIRSIAAGSHLTTLAFSEAGSRSHFWAPVSRAVVRGSETFLQARKSWVTSANHADSFVVSTQAQDASAPTESVLYVIEKGAKGMRVDRPFDGMGLRANDSAPMRLEDCKVTGDARLTENKKGMDMMLGVVLPIFNLGNASVSAGICRGLVNATANHLRTAKFEHLGATLGEALPTLRARLAEMDLATSALELFIAQATQEILAGAATAQLRVLESKALAGDTALRVSELALKACGGAAFSKQLDVDRYFRDAHASFVMAPTADVLKEFIGKALLGLPLM